LKYGRLDAKAYARCYGPVGGALVFIRCYSPLAITFFIITTFILGEISWHNYFSALTNFHSILCMCVLLLLYVLLQYDDCRLKGTDRKVRFVSFCMSLPPLCSSVIKITTYFFSLSLAAISCKRCSRSLGFMTIRFRQTLRFLCLVPHTRKFKWRREMPAFSDWRKAIKARKHFHASDTWNDISSETLSELKLKIGAARYLVGYQCSVTHSNQRLIVIDGIYTDSKKSIRYGIRVWVCFSRSVI